MNYNFTSKNIQPDKSIFIPSGRLDYGEIEELAEKRSESYDEDTFKRHYKGLIGECAVAEAYGVGIDRGIYEYGDGGIDLLLEIQGSEKTVDVKTTSRDNPTLRVRSKGPKVCQFYILCQILPHGVEIVGYKSADEVHSMDNWTRIDGSGCFEVDDDELTDPPMKLWTKVLSTTGKSAE